MKRIVLVLVLATGALSAQRAMGQASIGFRSIGASVAYVSPENVNGTFGLGVFADLGRITPEIGLEPRIEYWSASEEAFGSKASMRDVVVGARGKYYFDIANPKVHPFAGAGLGLHFLRAEATVSIPGLPTISSSASDTRLGVDFGGGLETNVSPLVDLNVELWYGIVSDANQFALRLGVSRKLGH